MKLINVHHGSLIHGTDKTIPGFEGSQVTPFPLESVFDRLYTDTILTEDMSSDPDVLEMTVQFQNTFDESISLKEVKKAQSRVDDRRNDPNDDTLPRFIVIEETVNAYGRHYAFTASSFRRQYDAFKWYSINGMYAVGVVVDQAIKTLTDRVSKWRNTRQKRKASSDTPTSLRARISNAIPSIR